MTNALQLHVTRRDRTVRETEAANEGSLLTILRGVGVDEISAMCAGNCACATCHVYVEADASLPEPKIEESEMLETLLHQTPASRLACQLTVGSGVKRLKVTVAPEE